MIDEVARGATRMDELNLLEIFRWRGKAKGGILEGELEGCERERGRIGVQRGGLEQGGTGREWYEGTRACRYNEHGSPRRDKSICGERTRSSKNKSHLV